MRLGIQGRSSRTHTRHSDRIIPKLPMTKTLSIALVSTCLLALLVALLAASAPATNPKEAARLNNIGVAYMNQQLFEKALKAFEEAAAKDPALEVARFNRGVALLNMQRAVEAFRRVTEIDANDADTWYFLGSTYAQLKQFPEAIAAFASALKLDPLDASAQFGLARAYQQSGQADPAHEAMKKFQYITQNKLGAPISLAYGEQGKYSRAEESPLAVEKVPAQIPVKFVDVTSEAGLPAKLGQFAPGIAGACFIDYDNDGKIDLFLAEGGAVGGPALFHNLGNGRFEEVTQKLDLANPLAAQVTACTAGDYDNDGFSDLALSTVGGILLLHNDKGNKFVDVTQAAGLPQNRLSAGSSSIQWWALNFVDYDHDGDLDLLVTAEAVQLIADEKQPKWDVWPGPAMVWRNNGNGTFTKVSKDLGLSEAAALSAIGTDYNNDRAVDLVITGSAKAPTIFENPREGKFPARQPWSSSMPGPTVGVAVLDFNHDGWMDLVFTHSGEPGITLWRNNQGKTFDRVALPETNWVRAYGVAAIDYDNDGWVDLVAVGETKEGKGEVRLFRNLGPDGFKDVTV